MVACSSGTAALTLAIECLKHKGSEFVAIPDFTMIACPRAAAVAGIDCVFIDCSDDKLLMQPKLLREALRGDLKDFPMVMAVHIYGRRCDMDAIAHEMIFKDMPLIEDLAEAHGVPVHPTTDAACWSFFSNKVIFGQEGGAVWFRDQGHAKLARQLRCLGFTDAHDFNHIPRGHNYRLADSLADLIIDSLGKVHGNLDRRRENVMIYDRICPKQWKMPPREVPWVFDLKIPDLLREHQKEIVRKLNEAGIAARCSFYPMSLQEEFRDCRTIGDGVAKKISNEVFYLPCDPSVTTSSISKSFEIINKFLDDVGPRL